jgi:hypothetical protein
MQLKVLVVTKYKWRSRLRKHKDIAEMMARGGIDATFTTLHLDVGKPEIQNKRITEAWFEKNISTRAKREEYNFAIFQFSEADGKRWGLEDGLRGHSFVDYDMFGEGWVRADEHSVVKFKDKSQRDKYSKVVPHEIAHELKTQGYTSLEIHDYDYKNERNNLEQFFIDMGDRRNLKNALLERLQALLSLLNRTPSRPLPSWNITQLYGVSNPTLYPQTGHHIGTDFHAPLGTPLTAPLDCVVTRGGYSPALGFWCEMKVLDWYMVALHLKSAPSNRAYKRGEKIAEIGNTGKIQGVHAHLEGWTRPMDRSLLTKANWRQLTFDITNKFK